MCETVSARFSDADDDDDWWYLTFNRQKLMKSRSSLCRFHALLVSVWVLSGYFGFPPLQPARLTGYSKSPIGVMWAWTCVGLSPGSGDQLQQYFFHCTLLLCCNDYAARSPENPPPPSPWNRGGAPCKKLKTRFNGFLTDVLGVAMVWNVGW